MTTPVTANAAWILSAQLPDGAIAQYVDRLAVSPYLANFAALGLARASEVTGDPTYVNAAWRWLLWYQAHQAPSGFVTDYQVVNGVLVSTGGMDSTDAYAGTFLLALRRAWKATGLTSRLAWLKPGLTGAIAAIEATQDVDGLTWAKPSWHVKYLMDQSETLAGLRAAAEMATALGDPALAARAMADADRLQLGAAALWNPATAAFDWALFPSGVRQLVNWANLYPDSLEQVWAVAFGLANSWQSSLLTSRFDALHPTWDQPASTDSSSSMSPIGYWPVAGLAMARAGYAYRAALGATSIQAGATAASNGWPFTVGIAGSLIQLETADGNYLSRG